MCFPWWPRGVYAYLRVCDCGEGMLSDRGVGYARVNSALNEAIFSGRFEGRPVYVTLGIHCRKIVASRTGFSVDTLEDDVANVAAGGFSKTGNPFKNALTMLEGWRESSPDAPPPFTGILYCLAHAAERMEDAEGINSANYYDRLEQVVGMPRERLQRHARSVTPLWNGLNEWLECSGYRFGRPTAIPFDGAWRYVGYALSQAVVRASDKKRFVQMFDRYGFVPGETVSERDVFPYIDAWLSTASAPARLKRRWSQTMLRSRIAQAALDCLSDWDGAAAVRGRPGESSVRLSLALALGGFPLKLELKLGLQQELDHPIEGLQRVGAPPRDPGFVISNALSGVFASISPAAEIGAAQVLRHGAKFEGADGKAYAYYPADVIPFVKSSSGGLWRAVNRVRFGERHMVLVRDAPRVRSDVEDILSEVSSIAECTIAKSSDLKGVPQGWVVYRDVLIMRRARGHYPEPVAVLDPLDESSALMLEGGLRLAQGVWHAQVPFKVRLLSQAPDNRIDVYEDISGTRSEALASGGGGGARCSMWVTPAKLRGASALAIVGYGAGKRSASKRLILRSANQPRPIGRHGEGAGGLRYLGVVSANDSDTGVSCPFVRGYVAQPLGKNFEGLGILDESWKQMPFVAEPVIDEDKDDDALDHEASSSPVSSEASTSHVHNWICEAYDGKRARSAPMFMECSQCGKATVERNRGKKREATTKSAVPVYKPFAKERTTIAPRELDYLFDALCFLGRGSWSQFNELASTFTDDALIVREVASLLAALGFIDLELERGASRVKRWSVCPPAIIFKNNNDAFMAGFRCVSLVEEIAKAVAELGGKIDYRVNEGRPTDIRISGLDAGSLSRLTSRLRDPLGRTISVLEGAAASLLSMCGGLERLEAALLPVTIGQCNGLQKLSLPTARWQAVDRVAGAGAYRFQSHGRTYCLVDHEGRAFAGAHPVVKTLAARQQGMRLHDYQEGSGKFVCIPGVEPPMLLARALVACSGAPPAVEGGYTVYRDVPAQVASGVMHFLYANKDLQQ